MTTESIRRKDQYDAREYTYQDAIEETVEAVHDRYNVVKLKSVQASHFDQIDNEWHATVEALVSGDGSE